MDSWRRQQALFLHCSTRHSQLAPHPQECRFVPLFTLLLSFSYLLTNSLYILHLCLCRTNWNLTFFSFFQKTKGLQRCGKSCRLRWTNYLRPDLKHGQFTDAEEQTIVKLHSIVGNRCITLASCFVAPIIPPNAAISSNILSGLTYSKWTSQMVNNRSPASRTHRQRCEKPLEYQAEKEAFWHGNWPRHSQTIFPPHGGDCHHTGTSTGGSPYRSSTWLLQRRNAPPAY